MMKANYIIRTVLASFILTGIVNFQAASAQEYVPKVTKKKLHQAPLPGAEGKEMMVVHLAIPPGYVGGKHMHTGPVFVYVLEGELTVVLDGESKTFKTGEMYPEDINTAMVGKNLSASDDLEILVFQVGEIGKPMMIKVD